MSADIGGSWGVVADPYVPPLLGPRHVIPRCGCVTSGEGPPDDSVGDNGDVYIDETTDLLYEKQGDVYVQIGGGAGDTVLFQGHYGVTQPPITPTASIAVARSLDPPNITWWWNGTSWE